MTEIGRRGDGKNAVRHSASTVVSFSALEKAMLCCAESDQLQQAPITESSTSIANAGASWICSVLLGLNVPADGLLSTWTTAKECRCPTLPFRSTSDGVAGQLHSCIKLDLDCRLYVIYEIVFLNRLQLNFVFPSYIYSIIFF